MPNQSLVEIVKSARACRICESHLVLGPRPVFQVDAEAKILIIGQAPGSKVHVSGVPFQDQSGDRLRDWLGVTSEQFYDPKLFAILPMGFCYPGKGTSGDLPPRPECAPQWHDLFLRELKSVRLTLLFGQYALARYLPEAARKTLADAVSDWRNHLPKGRMPLVHPSPRNQMWLKKNPWFELQLVPELKLQIRQALDT